MSTAIAKSANATRARWQGFRRILALATREIGNATQAARAQGTSTPAAKVFAALSAQFGGDPEDVFLGLAWLSRMGSRLARERNILTVYDYDTGTGEVGAALTANTVTINTTDPLPTAVLAPDDVGVFVRRLLVSVSTPGASDDAVVVITVAGFRKNPVQIMVGSGVTDLFEAMPDLFPLDGVVVDNRLRFGFACAAASDAEPVKVQIIGDVGFGDL